ncbi:class I SAM-dependent methyltransferase [Aquirhabdus parva]|uniref:Methyltransferase domain-containing protein n=1 Tax=Aquirhabdus parva TaxID=2283318 RepID=A0A345P722_9GAMM|nr:methyltransferase domain-containing protein [Aquirhabdus parva]AXI03081.1 methyltransferase domain-containing protein [Aquirhabdus parva]
MHLLPILPPTPPVEVKISTVIVGDHAFTLQSLKDKQQFSDPEGVAERAGISSSTWPLFGSLWPSGVILAELISIHELDGLRILELGCGLGLASLVAHQRGADITASDYHPIAQDFFAINVMLNHLEPMHFALCDWEKLQPELGLFDLIIGSDLLYEPNHPALLSAFIHRHSKPQVEVIIIDPDRRQQREFTRAMEGLNYIYSMAKASIEQTDRLLFKGKIMTYRRG